MTPPDRMQAWLSSTLTTAGRTSMGVAAAGAVGGAFFMLITFVLVYGGFFFISKTFLHWPLSVIFVLSIVAIIVLFIGNFTTSREYLESYSFTTGTASDKVVNFYVPQVGMGSNINPIAPDSAHSYLKMFMTVLYTGPRMVMSCVHNLRRARRLKSLDIEGVVAVLSFLMGRDKRVSLVELGAALPGRDLAALLPQVAEIDGVLFLKSEPPGLSLSTDLRREIAGTQ
jgi:energy-coupling factor transporter transmembrane protein EcfT